MFNTNAKFIVLASPFRANLGNDTNMRRYVEAQHSLKAQGFTFENVLSYFCEEGQLIGSQELSLAIPCKTAAQIKSMARMFCGMYNQGCVAVWNRDSNTLWLADKEGHVFHTCGTMQASKDVPDVNAWTYNGGMYFYAE